MKSIGTSFNSVSEKGEVILYATGTKGPRLEVKLEGETVWLTQKQMAQLFDKDLRTINEHIRNVFKEKELEEKSVIRNFRITASDGKAYVTNFYNLDVVISIGYRVKSTNGTRFRIWATGLLKKHLVEGYTVNHKLLAQQAKKLDALQKAIKLMHRAKAGKVLDYKEATGLLEVIDRYSYALGLLDDYDKKTLKISNTSKGGRFKLGYDAVIKAVGEMKAKCGGSEIFGKEKDQSLKSSVATIYQTFSGQELYPSIEEKAANLLYFIVKNHSFIDGNKRISAAVFLWFLEENGLLYRSDGSKRLADNALVALTLMIAESRPQEKDVITTLVVNLINKSN
jgi:prophage maintenance system killer protein